MTNCSAPPMSALQLTGHQGTVSGFVRLPPVLSGCPRDPARRRCRPASALPRSLRNPATVAHTPLVARSSSEQCNLRACSNRPYGDRPVCVRVTEVPAHSTQGTYSPETGPPPPLWHQLRHSCTGTNARTPSMPPTGRRGIALIRASLESTASRRQLGAACYTCRHSRPGSAPVACRPGLAMPNAVVIVCYCITGEAHSPSVRPPCVAAAGAAIQP